MYVLEFHSERLLAESELIRSLLVDNIYKVIAITAY